MVAATLAIVAALALVGATVTWTFRVAPQAGEAGGAPAQASESRA